MKEKIERKFGIGVIVCIFNRDFSKIFLLKRNKAKRDLNKADWGNPGGRVEWGEKLAEACVREVKEECGVDDVHISRPLQDSYHIFTKDDQQILKHTNWFEMTSNHNGELKGDEKEGITEVSWIKNDQLEEILSNSYPSIRDLIQSATS